MSARKANVARTSDQAEVKIVLELDGSGRSNVQTGAPLLDHLLALFARSGAFDLNVQCQPEDVGQPVLMAEAGACLGLAMDKALGDKQGIRRLGHCCAPIDDNLARAVVDITGHPCFVYHVAARSTAPAGLNSNEVERFWRAFTEHARVNLHIELLYGAGGLPALEAVFKAAAHALREACQAPPNARQRT